MALPPNTVFEAVLEEVSRADAPAAEDGPHPNRRPGQPPTAFSIAYDRSAIDERLTYGGYEAAAQALHFQQPVSTRIGCPPPLDRLERALLDVLENTSTWRFYGQFLELYDADGRAVALLQAVYLR